MEAILSPVVLMVKHISIIYVNLFSGSEVQFRATGGMVCPSQSFLYVYFLGEGPIIHRVICSGVHGLGKLTVIVSLGFEIEGWKFDHSREKHTIF